MGILTDYENAEAVNAALNKGVEANNSVSELKGDLTNVTGTEKIEFINNKKVDLSYSIGETVDLTPVDEPLYRCAVLDCEYGDIFLINCAGGVSPRAYGFVDENNKLIKVAIQNQTLNNEVIVVPENAKKIVINDRKSNGVCYKNLINKKVEVIFKEFEEHKIESNEKISIVEEASSIRQSLTYTDFIFMHIDGKGILTTNHNRNVCFRDAIFVKMGSTLSVDSGYKYQYAMYDKYTDEFISRQTWKTETTVLDTDCKIRVEISDKSESVLSDLSIVEHLHMTLYSVLEPVSEIVGSYIDKDIMFASGKNINLNYDVGTTIDLNPEAVSFYSYAIQEVEPGDVVVVNAKGGINPRVWGFVDENNVLISVADKSTNEKQQVDLRIVVPNNATKVIINSMSRSLGHCYVSGLYKNVKSVVEKTSIHDQSITKLEEDVSSLSGEEQNALRQSNNIVNTLGIDSFKGKILEIAEPTAYKAWSFIGKVGKKLICLYAVGNSHVDAKSNIFYKLSENGVIWSTEKKILSSDNQRDNITGKGYDNDGNFIFLGKTWCTWSISH